MELKLKLFNVFSEVFSWNVFCTSLLCEKCIIINVAVIVLMINVLLIGNVS